MVMGESVGMLNCQQHAKSKQEQEEKSKWLRGQHEQLSGLMLRGSTLLVSSHFKVLI